MKYEDFAHKLGYEDYIDTRYKPSKRDLICYFYMDTAKGVKLEHGIGAVAAESSTGTWTDLATIKPYMMKDSAKVYSIQKIGKNAANIKIAYPNELFEEGNLQNIMR